jgi:PhnB protein
MTMGGEMSRVCTYLNFQGQAEEAFEYYSSVFDTTYATPLIRFGDVPGSTSMSEEEKRGVMNVALPILNGHIIMGTDFIASAGHQIRVGNNTTIVLETDTREQADEFYNALSLAGSEKQDMADMFWGAYWGVCLDRFGIRWMISHTPESP